MEAKKKQELNIIIYYSHTWFLSVIATTRRAFENKRYVMICSRLHRSYVLYKGISLKLIICLRFWRRLVIWRLRYKKRGLEKRNWSLKVNHQTVQYSRPNLWLKGHTSLISTHQYRVHTKSGFVWKVTEHAMRAEQCKLNLIKTTDQNESFKMGTYMLRVVQL